MTQPMAPLPYWDYFLPMIFVAGAAFRSRQKRKGAKATRRGSTPIKPGVQYRQDPATGKWIPTVPTFKPSNPQSDVQRSNVQPVNGFSLHWPLDPGFIVTQTFQEHLQYKLEHNLKYYNGGLDLAYSDIREGANVHAAADGILKKASYSPEGYGNVVYVDHLNGFVSIYAHLSGFAGILVGNIVAAGDIVGYLGHSGNCRGGPGNPDGTHLHFGVRYQGVPVDPAVYLS